MDKVNALNDLRAGIDEIDRKMLRLFAARMDKVSAIAEYKRAHERDVLDKAREDRVLAQTEIIADQDLRRYAADFMRTLMDLSKKYQREYLARKQKQPIEISRNGEQDRKKDGVYSDVQVYNDGHVSARVSESGVTVGIQGIPGSYSEEALRDYFGENVNRKSYGNFADVFEALQAGEIEYGILPLENSSTGGVAEVYDLLCLYGFHIVGEKCVHVNHNLLAPVGAKIEDIREVYSHPQALLQCSNYLKKHPEWTYISCSNTAVSAKLVRDSGLFQRAAIGSLRAAELYGLDILERGISNKNDNYTRFIIIGNSLVLKPNNNKLSLALTLPHEPGSLYRTLSHFAENNLNMLKIESRPIREKNWEYLFYIDFEGNLLDQKVAKAVESIRANSSFFRLLGNYRADPVTS